MLALTRKTNEAVWIFDPEAGTKVRVGIASAHGGAARLAFGADREILILREEVALSGGLITRDDIPHLCRDAHGRTTEPPASQDPLPDHGGQAGPP